MNGTGAEREAEVAVGPQAHDKNRSVAEMAEGPQAHDKSVVPPYLKISIRSKSLSSHDPRFGPVARALLAAS